MVGSIEAEDRRGGEGRYGWREKGKWMKTGDGLIGKNEEKRKGEINGHRTSSSVNSTRPANVANLNKGDHSRNQSRPTEPTNISYKIVWSQSLGQLNAARDLKSWAHIYQGECGWVVRIRGALACSFLKGKEVFEWRLCRIWDGSDR